MLSMKSDIPMKQFILKLDEDQAPNRFVSWIFVDSFLCDLSAS